MSQDEQAQSIGRLIVAYVESKRKLAVMRAEISRISDDCTRAGKALHEHPDDPAVSNDCMGLPDSAKLNALLADYHSARNSHAEFLRRIKELGLEG